MTICCGNCRFFRRDGNKHGGVCRERPPVPICVGQAQLEEGNMIPAIATYWPQTNDIEWCGAHEPGLDLTAVDRSHLSSGGEGEA